MAINFDKFVEWAESRFSDVIVKGNEIHLNSIFSDDTKHHLWCNPTGGKKSRDFGVYHCWKTDQKGSLVKLVQLVDKCSREEALSTLLGYQTIAQLEKKLDEFFNDQSEVIEEPKQKSGLQLPYGSNLISELGTNNWFRKHAEDYLSRRKIPIDGLYVCMEQPYKFRIVIPYYGRDGRLIYWNSRHISPKAKLRYLGPPKECGVGKEDVIYMAGNWPQKGKTLYLCEGEFNAISLKLCELSAAACGGKNMSEKQAIMLSDYKIVICLDRDKAGSQGSAKMMNMLSLSKNINSNDKLMFVRPPEQYNDWNEMYIEVGAVILNAWIKQKQKAVDFLAPHGMSGDILGFL